VVAQAPQWLGSVAVRAQSVPQLVWPGARQAQAPPTQLCADPQRSPHPPQFSGSLLVSVQLALRTEIELRPSAAAGGEHGDQHRDARSRCRRAGSPVKHSEVWAPGAEHPSKNLH
jgi:hypothetical protein